MRNTQNIHFRVLSGDLNLLKSPVKYLEVSLQSARIPLVDANLRSTRFVTSSTGTGGYGMVFLRKLSGEPFSSNKQKKKKKRPK